MHLQSSSSLLMWVIIPVALTSPGGPISRPSEDATPSLHGLYRMISETRFPSCSPGFTSPSVHSVISVSVCRIEKCFCEFRRSRKTAVRDRVVLVRGAGAHLSK